MTAAKNNVEEAYIVAEFSDAGYQRCGKKGLKEWMAEDSDCCDERVP